MKSFLRQIILIIILFAIIGCEYSINNMPLTADNLKIAIQSGDLSDFEEQLLVDYFESNKEKLSDSVKLKPDSYISISDAIRLQMQAHINDSLRKIEEDGILMAKMELEARIDREKISSLFELDVDDFIEIKYLYYYNDDGYLTSPLISDYYTETIKIEYKSIKEKITYFQLIEEKYFPSSDKRFFNRATIATDGISAFMYSDWKEEWDYDKAYIRLTDGFDKSDSITFLKENVIWHQFIINDSDFYLILTYDDAVHLIWILSNCFGCKYTLLVKEYDNMWGHHIDTTYIGLYKKYAWTLIDDGSWGGFVLTRGIGVKSGPFRLKYGRIISNYKFGEMKW